jgi:hypothetical protein
VDREEAEKIVSRDLPGAIAEVLKGFPFKPPDSLAQQLYETAAPAAISALLDGTVLATPDGHLTFEAVQSSGKLTFKLTDSAGNATIL